MPIGINDLFEVSGLKINEEVTILSGSIEPNIFGYSAIIGSMYLCTNGTTWKKVGALDLEWVIESKVIDGGAF